MIRSVKSLAGRVNKRSFWLLAFLITVPLSVSAVIALSSLTDQLLQQETRRLRQFGKNFLMSTYWELQKQEIQIKKSVSLKSELGVDELVAVFDKDFDKYAVVGPGLYLANGVTRKELDGFMDRAKDQRSSKPMVFTVKGANENRIWVAGTYADGVFAVVALDPFPLWAHAEYLPDNMELCVVEETGVRVYCPHEFSDEVVKQAINSSANSMTGDTAHTGGDTSYIGSYWTLLLQSGFTAPNWLVLTRLPRDQVFSPIKKFAQYFVPLIVVVVMSSIFLLLLQVRKNLVPLQSLLEGTKKISRKDFSTRIQLEGEDEFAELAKSFNLMSSQLDRQFLSIEVSAQIDETILSTFDIAKVVNLLLVRIFEIFDCGLSSVVLIGEEEKPNQIHYCLKDGAPYTVDTVSELNLNEIRRLVWFDAEREIPTAVNAVFECIGQQFSGICAPISVDGATVGLLILDMDIDEQDTEVVEEVLNDFSQRLAVAKSADEWEAQLKYQARHDLLTGLPNRLSFQKDLNNKIKTVGGTSVLFVDLDHFKNINDTRGHSTGDQLLKLAADRLQQAVASKGKVFRLSGDEFTIIVDCVDELEVEQFAENILDHMRAPFTIDALEYLVTASVGVARYPDNGKTVEMLVKNADLAMYFAKQDGRNKIRFFHSSMVSPTYCRTVLEADLRKALNEQQFFLMYQPQINIRELQVVCLEALLRWQHPEHGVILPNVFIPVAEDLGLIQDIDKWVVSTVCEQYSEWTAIDIGIDKIAVNVSPRTLQGNGYLDHIRELMDRHESKGFLELEVTENVFLENTEQVLEILERLKSLGIHIALDDFGTGYSSMSYLNRFPIDVLKIDMSFVKEISKDKGAESIAQAMIRIASSLHLSVVAEGVENEVQLNFLDKEGCQVVQGFYYSRPMRADQVLDYVDSFKADILKRVSL
ncbi:MAG: EAL domain-containing protein [Arenicellales bacterium]|nr:EAL domain-containing protein [Arenicellales bacterium]